MILLNCNCTKCDDIPCEGYLQLDSGQVTNKEGKLFRGLQVVELGEVCSIIIPEWLAVVMERAIQEHKEESASG